MTLSELKPVLRWVMPRAAFGTASLYAMALLAWALAGGGA